MSAPSPTPTPRYPSRQASSHHHPALQSAGVPPLSAPRIGVFCFSIQAEADPGVMPRVLELFAKRGQVPRRWVSDRIGSGGRELAIDLQMEGLTQPLADYIARCLRQLPCVSLVLLSEKLSAETLTA